MANYDCDPNQGLTDKRKSGSSTGSGNASNLSTAGNYASVAALRTRLAAANGAFYTSARLDQMSRNDMVYALRTIDDNAGIR